jgi:hypothetical protein
MYKWLMGVCNKWVREVLIPVSTELAKIQTTHSFEYYVRVGLAQMPKMFHSNN